MVALLGLKGSSTGFLYRRLIASSVWCVLCDARYAGRQAHTHTHLPSPLRIPISHAERNRLERVQIVPNTAAAKLTRLPPKPK